jgi:hypothetical protein
MLEQVIGYNLVCGGLRQAVYEKRNIFQIRFYKYNLSQNWKGSYSWIFTTKFNNSPILITII